MPQSESGCPMPLQEIEQPLQEAALPSLEFGGNRGSFEQSIAQVGRGTPPYGFQAYVLIVQLARGRFEEEEGTARLEMHSHHLSLLSSVDDEILRVCAYD